MAGQNGRDLRMKQGATVLATLNTKTMTVNLTPVDTTNDDDDGFTSYLDRPGVRQLSMEVAGVSSDTVLRDIALEGGVGGSVKAEYTLEWLNSNGNGSVVYSLVGDFVLSNYS